MLLPGRERVHRWWAVKRLADTDNVLMGKPSVVFQKVVNTRPADDSDEIVAVNAQQYVVLVTDVPDLRAERDRCAL